MADQCVQVTGGSNVNNYANVDCILDVALQTRCDAVWAGWGHASENPKLPETLNKNNIAFLGPPDNAMWALGDKIASTIVAQSANIPTLPWNGSDLKLDWSQEDISNGSFLSVPPHIYQKALISELDEGQKSADKIGYPVMIKASEGGGGKGIRRVDSSEDFANAFRQVQNELPGSPIFIMKCANNVRHLEVQLLADKYGEAISVFGRDCSIQRRHQKIIEEAPIIIAPEHIVEEMEKGAVQLAKLVGYRSAGTVEYLYDPSCEKFYFLELNPRLQVEHPCTEMISNVNLPAAQLQVAMGIPLSSIKDVCALFGIAKNDDDSSQFAAVVNAKRPKPNGHVIAARITSENPAKGFKPSSGTVEELNFKSNKNVWGYFSITTTGGVHEFADSQFGHCFSWGETRQQACESLVMALKELNIRGDFPTTVEYLIQLLETMEYRTNSISTAWLDRLIAQQKNVDQIDPLLAAACAAVGLAEETILNSFQHFHNSLERGQLLPSSNLKTTVDIELVHDDVKYVIQVTKVGPSQYFLFMNDSTIQLEAHRLSDGGILVSIDANTYATYLQQDVCGVRAIVGNRTCVFTKEYDPTVIRSTTAGKLVNYLVEDGEHVTAGMVYAEIEVMKMLMELTASENGHIQFVKRPGAVLHPGTIIAKLQLDDPSQVRRAQLFNGKLDSLCTESNGNNFLSNADVHNSSQHGTFHHSHSLMSLSTATWTISSEKLNKRYMNIRSAIESILMGYCRPDSLFVNFCKDLVDCLFRILSDPRLPLAELQEVIRSASGKIPIEVERAVLKQLSYYESNVTSVLISFPSQEIARIIDRYAGTLAKREDRDRYFANTQSILEILQRYRSGINGHMKHVIHDILRSYYSSESKFRAGSYDKFLAQLREEYKDDIQRIIQIVFSTANAPRKNFLVIYLLECIEEREISLSPELEAVLNDLTTLNRLENVKVSLKARQILIASHEPPYELRENQVGSIFLSALDPHNREKFQENLQRLINTETAIFDVLPNFFFNQKAEVIASALEVYVRRAYCAYDLVSLQHGVLEEFDSHLIIEFHFLLPTSHPNRMGLQLMMMMHTPCNGNSGTPVTLPSAQSFSAAPITPRNARLQSYTDETPDTHAGRFIANSNSQPRLSLSNDNANFFQSNGMFGIGEHAPTQSQQSASNACQRIGIMAAFSSIEECQNNFDKLVDRFVHGGGGPAGTGNRLFELPFSPSVSYLEQMLFSPQNLDKTGEPISIINVAIKIDKRQKEDVRFSNANKLFLY